MSSPDRLGTPRVSVVIPARDAATGLVRVLDALASQTVSRDQFEVVLVDDASEDDTSEVAERSGVARVVLAPARQGQAAARNLGARKTMGPALAFLDADCVPYPDWIERGLAEMEQSEIDLLAGRIDMEVNGRPSTLDLLAVTHNFDQERYVSEGFSAGGNLWVRRDVFEKLGGFDVALLYDEDREFTLRATTQGAVLHYAPSVVVVHPPRRGADLIRRSYRTAAARSQVGGVQLRARLRSGPYAGQDYVRGRLERIGYEPAGAQLRRLQLAKLACIRVPMALGALAGATKRRFHRHRRRAALR